VQPPAVAYQNGHVTLTDERRLVTVLFADLVGFTGRAESADPEAVREIQRTYFAAVSGEVERYGGTVEKFIGDAVMAIFGAPQAHDDDAERALRAALRIRDAVQGMDDELQVRIGVNTGEVVGGMGSGPQAGDYTVSGDAVNVAARLQQTATPNEILVGGTTRRLSAEAFAFAPLAELALRGRAEGVEAWRLERELPERPRLRGGEAELVGRTRERQMLESALEEAAAGHGLIVAVAGEAGIGKSRLALEMRHRAESNGFASAWTTSRSYATSFPYHLVDQLVRQVLGPATDGGTRAALTAFGVAGDDETLDRWAAALDALLEESETDARLSAVSPAGRQRLLVQAVVSVLRARSQRQPLLLVLDDLHWADPASLAVIEELLDVVVELPVAVLALYRSGWKHGWEGKSCYQQLNLRALLPDEARAMAAQLTPDGQVSSELTERVLERSAGNPFFLEELLRGEGQAASQPGHRLPETIHEMLLARLDALPRHARLTLQLASVVGVEFSEEIVAALATDTDGTDRDTDDTLRVLQRAELIVPRVGDSDWTHAFRHPLIHEVAYRSLLLSTRRTLHGRIARWLEEHGGDELVAELAQHYRHSDDPSRARHYLPLAGERAERLNASREALGWYTDAADAFRDEPARRAEMLEAAARQTYLIGDIGETTVLQQEAVDLYETAGVEVAALNARRWLGRYFWLQGNPEEADRQIGRAIDGLERLPPTPELAYAYSFQSQSLMLIPDVDAGEMWARKAIAVAEATGATGALVHAYNNLGACLQWKGDPAGLDYLRRSLDLSLEHNLTDDAGRAYANMSGQGMAIFPFPYAESEAFLQEALDYAARTIPGGVFDQWIRNGWVEFLFTTARWSEADRAIAGFDWTNSGAYMQTAVASYRSLLSSFRGRFDDAAEQIADYTDAAVRIRDLQAVIPALVAVAHAEAGLGNDAAAVAALRRVIEIRGERHEGSISCWFIFEASDVLTAILARDPGSSAAADGVAMVAAFAPRMASEASFAAEQTRADVMRAMFGAAVDQVGALCRRLGLPLPSVEADPAFPGRVDAAATLERERRLFDGARVRLWLAEEGGDGALFGAARQTFEQLGAHPYLARADQELARQIAERGRRSG
jgi:adenylate cyclase